MKRIAICGGNGFIGGHLVKRLKEQGHWVRVIDIKKNEWWDTGADEEMILDLRIPKNAKKALTFDTEYRYDKPIFDEVYQLASDMGGMGFISSHDIDCLVNNARININMIDAAAHSKVMKYFYSSSVCVYKDTEKLMKEEDAYPAEPDNEYGWEKLYSERVAWAYDKDFPIEVHVARFQNTYGPYGTWDGGREKAPAALSRKIAKSHEIEVWGDGTAIRNYIYIDDLLDGVQALMKSDIKESVNIGTDEYVTVDELIDTIGKVAGKEIAKKYIDGPVGVQSRNFSNEKIKSLGWKPKHTLLQGIQKTYPWIEKQVYPLIKT